MAVIIECVGADPQICHHPISFSLKTYFLFMVITPMEGFDHAEAFTLLPCLLFLKDFFLFNLFPPSDPFRLLFSPFCRDALLAIRLRRERTSENRKMRLWQRQEGTSRLVVLFCRQRMSLSAE